jgi:hypothetical protein
LDDLDDLDDLSESEPESEPESSARVEPEAESRSFRESRPESSPESSSASLRPLLDDSLSGRDALPVPVVPAPAVSEPGVPALVGAVVSHGEGPVVDDSVPFGTTGAGIAVAVAAGVGSVGVGFVVGPVVAPELVLAPDGDVSVGAERASGAAVAGATVGAEVGDELANPVLAEPVNRRPATEEPLRWASPPWSVRGSSCGPTNGFAAARGEGVQSARLLRASALSWAQVALSSLSGGAAAATPCGRKTAPLTSNATVSGRQP